MQHRFLLHYKLVFIFGILFLITGMIEGIFSVVADEIRKLAEDSASQGKTITATLKTLSGEIETLSALSRTVEEKFNAIFTLAEQVKEMAAGAVEINNTVQEVNELTQKNKRSIEALAEEVSKFKV